MDQRTILNDHFTQIQILISFFLSILFVLLLLLFLKGISFEYGKETENRF